MRKLLIISMFLGTVGFSANGQIHLTARDVYDACTREDMSWIGFCDGYVQAVVELANATGRLCIPNGVTRNELAMMIARMRPNLVATYETGAHLVVGVVGQRYGC